jgi:glycosyltransferase involved in cell wall biosynthesis
MTGVPDVTEGGARRDAISIVVATRDRPRQLQGCLRSLLESARRPDDEIIVVDSCSRGPATAEIAAASGVRLIRCEVPGASHARNVGWRAARHPVVAFIDDDVRVAPTWAQALSSTFEAFPEVAFVTGRLGLRHEESRTERPVAYFDAEKPLVIDPSVVIDFGHGANLAVRAAALQAVDGYDELLGPGAPFRAAEDLDLVDRLLERGYTGRYEPTAGAVHLQWRRRPDLVRLEWCYGVGQGARLARLRRRNRARYRAIRRITWRDQGGADLVVCLRRGHEFEALLVAVRLVGTATGQLAAMLSEVGVGRRRRQGGGAGSGGGRTSSRLRPLQRRRARRAQMAETRSRS